MDSTNSLQTLQELVAEIELYTRKKPEMIRLALISLKGIKSIISNHVDPQQPAQLQSNYETQYQNNALTDPVFEIDEGQVFPFQPPIFFDDMNSDQLQKVQAYPFLYHDKTNG